MARTNVPKFGNWETEEDIPYTAYFENPRRVSSSEKVNPNKSPDNPNLVSRFEARRGSEKQEHMVKQEDGEHNVRSYDSPSRPNGGRRASVNSPKRVARINGGGFRSADNSPMHPHYQAKKGSTVSSPSRERKGPSDGNGNLGLAPSTPGRSRLRTVVRGNETPDRGASVPKFGEWDETDPSSADGFTHIFNKVKEERHGSTGDSNATAVQTQQSDKSKKSKSKHEGGAGDLPCRISHWRWKESRMERRTERRWRLSWRENERRRR
ncbi:RPM1-interacting protein 4 isoform X2 [Spinacia oleracea]|uniref:RPM1-interacting protein 4 isoform X2 n=1 Tax=Spinacia oleracea TaxID=3562 RepID=A0ABM3R5P1_SPIOL|nr:RPM1-interacting protein 4 isoform X2 [Spinacia oleracea]